MVNTDCAISAWRLPCSQVAQLAGRYSGWVALMPMFCCVKSREELPCWLPVMTSMSRLLRFTPALSPTAGRMPALACAARATVASYWARAPW